MGISKITKDVLVIFKEYMHPCICGIPIAAKLDYMCIIHSNHRDTLMHILTKEYMCTIYRHTLGIICGSQFSATEM